MLILLSHRELRRLPRGRHELVAMAEYLPAPRMEPGQVVEASLADLADGVMVSAPASATSSPSPAWMQPIWRWWAWPGPLNSPRGTAATPSKATPVKATATVTTAAINGQR